MKNYFNALMTLVILFDLAPRVIASIRKEKKERIIDKVYEEYF